MNLSKSISRKFTQTKAFSIVVTSWYANIFLSLTKFTSKNIHFLLKIKGKHWALKRCNITNPGWISLWQLLAVLSTLLFFISKVWSNSRGSLGPSCRAPPLYFRECLYLAGLFPGDGVLVSRQWLGCCLEDWYLSWSRSKCWFWCGTFMVF